MKGMAIALSLVVMVCGCVSKSAARRQRNEAYIAGKNSGLAQALQAQTRSVTVIGDVKNQVLAWSRDLTVAKAFLAADYVGVTEPKGFVVRRGAQEFHIEANRLLNGEDFELDPGDVLEIRQ